MRLSLILSTVFVVSSASSASESLMDEVTAKLAFHKQAIATPLFELEGVYDESLSLRDDMIKLRTSYLTLSSMHAQHILHISSLTSRGFPESAFVKHLKAEAADANESLRITLDASETVSKDWSQRLEDIRVMVETLGRAFSEADAYIKDVHASELHRVTIESEEDEEDEEEERTFPFPRATAVAESKSSAAAATEALEDSPSRRLMDSDSSSSDEDELPFLEESEPTSIPPPLLPRIHYPSPIDTKKLAVSTPPKQTKFEPLDCEGMHASEVRAAFQSAWKSGNFTPPEIKDAVKKFELSIAEVLINEALVSVQQEEFDKVLRTELDKLGMKQLDKKASQEEIPVISYTAPDRRLMMQEFDYEDDEEEEEDYSVHVGRTVAELDLLASYIEPEKLEPAASAASAEAISDLHTDAQLRDLIASWEKEMKDQKHGTSDLEIGGPETSQRIYLDSEMNRVIMIDTSLSGIISQRYSLFLDLQVAHERFFENYRNLVSAAVDLFPELEPRLSSVD
jgi:hypothetical protein